MIYLIDGHNLISQMPNISLDDPNDEVHLLFRLRSWAAADKKRQVLVIFDKGMPAGKNKSLSNSDVKVQFAPANTTADQVIIRRINRTKNPPEITLVTSDNMIIAAAKVRGMPHLTSKQFVREMQVDKRPTPPPRQIENPQVGTDEVDEWLALFGPPKPRPKPEAPPPPPPISVPKQQGEPKPKPKPATPDDYKRGRAKIAEDELKEWLDLFGGGGK